MPRPAATKNSRKKHSVRDRLLAVATDLFAQAGFDGTTVDGIVAKAKVNKRMVYHYFGSKEDLYHEVLAEAYRTLEVMEVSTFSHGGSLAALTEEIVRTYFNFLRDHPEFCRLLLWENLNNGKGLEGADFRMNKDPVLGALGQFLQAGMEAGKIRRDMDAAPVDQPDRALPGLHLEPLHLVPRSPDGLGLGAGKGRWDPARRAAAPGWDRGELS